jgi:hypothetical protein
MGKKLSVGWGFLAIVAFYLLLSSGCALRPEPINQHNFGKVYIGTTAETQQVCWRNHSKDALDVVGILVFPTNGPFAIKPFPFHSFVLQSGSCSQYFTFTFTPTRAGTTAGEAVPQIIQGAEKVQAYGLSGTGVYQIAGGVLIISGDHMKRNRILDFGSIVFPKGAASQRQFKLVNKGNKPVQLDVVWSKGKQGFSVVQPAGLITVPAHGRVGVTLQFTPPRLGTFTDGVTFVDRAKVWNKAGTAVGGKGIPD